LGYSAHIHVALHFLSGQGPSSYGVVHFLDEQDFPTMALMEVGQKFVVKLSPIQLEKQTPNTFWCSSLISLVKI
jgi:hypothetical protein